MNKNFWFKFKIITLISIIVWINNIIFLNASEYSLKKGWNLIGIHQNNFDIEKFPNTHIIWKYKDNNWYVASTNSNVLNFIKDHNIKTFSAVNASDGIWIELLKETNVSIVNDNSIEENPNIKIQKGWNLVSLKINQDINVSKYFNNDDIKLIWTYRDLKWYAYSPNEQIRFLINKAKINLLKNIKSTDGFWVYSTADTELIFDKVEKKEFTDGNGTKLNPYQISSCEELQNIKNHLSSYFILKNDIDCKDTIKWNNGSGFEPIAIDTNKYFNGYFDGKNHKIYNLHIKTSKKYIGLFGKVRGYISNLKLIDVDINSTNPESMVGALAGYSLYNKIENITISGNISSKGITGGIIGYMLIDEGDYLSNSQSNTIIDIDINNLGNAIFYHRVYVGGLVGSINSNGSRTNQIGSGGNIQKSKSFAKIHVKIKNSKDIRLRVGGIVGSLVDGTSGGDILNSYSQGYIKVVLDNVKLGYGDSGIGGLVGSGMYYSEIVNSYSTTKIDYETINCNPNIIIGGLAGDSGYHSIVKNSYWDINATNIKTSPIGIGKTTYELKNSTSESDIYKDWDSSIWFFGTNLDYPTLLEDNNSFLPRPIIIVENNITNKDKIEVTIKASKSGILLINEKETDINISKKPKKISLDIKGEDGEKKFAFSYISNDNKISSVTYITIIKDTTAPKKPKLEAQLPSITTKDELTINIQGERESILYLNDEKIGVFEDSGYIPIKLKLNDGENDFKIVLKDKAGNKSEALEFSIQKREKEFNVEVNLKYITKKNHKIKITYQADINTTAILENKPLNGEVNISKVEHYTLPKAVIADQNNYYEYNNSLVKQDVDLLIVGLYEGSSRHYDSNRNHIVGKVDVNITNGGDKPLILAFSSYEPILWNFSIEEGVVIKKIILNGYYEQSFLGIDSSKVEKVKLYACGYSLPYNGGGCDTNKLIKKIEDYTKLKLTKFIGQYRSNKINITTTTNTIKEISSNIEYIPNKEFIGNDDFDIRFVNNQYFDIKNIKIDVIEPKILKSKISKNFINGKYIVDIDSDGDLDILTTNSWYENDGEKDFIKHTLPFKARLVFASDMDNDGDIDIVCYMNSQINLYKNDGFQHFTKYTTIDNRSMSYDSNSIYLADMDNDGDMDVIAAWFGQDWYENDGDGNFIKHRMNGTGKDIIAEDIDKDGDMDYIESDNNLIWHENNGNQSFISHRISDKNIGSASSFAIDIDRDGDIDIISVRRWKNGIELYLNDGNQNFTKKIVSNNKYSSYIFATDIDKDGNIDILNGNIWFKNDGKNNFEKQSYLQLDNKNLVKLISN